MTASAMEESMPIILVFLASLALLASGPMALALAQQQRGPVQAVPKAMSDCDRLAASPDDPGRTAPPVYSAKLDRVAAITVCAEAVKLDTDNPRLLYQLGRALDWNQQYELARSYYGAASDMGYAPAQVALGLLFQYGDGGFADPAGAMQLYERAAKQNDARAMTLIAGLHASGQGLRQDEKEAEAWLRRAAATGEPVGLNALGLWLGAAGRELDKAEKMARQAVAAASSDPSFLDTLGLVLIKRGEHAAAIAQYEKAIELQPDFAPYHDRLGDAQAGAGEKDDAQASWRKALTLPAPIAGDDPLFDRAETQAKLSE